VFSTVIRRLWRLVTLYNDAMPRIHLFLSHISCEANLADIVEDHVTRDFIGLVSVFVSTQASIVVGSKWLDELTIALNEANLHVVLSSPTSVERKWINFEAGAAHVRGLPIIPLCHSGLTAAQLPVPLSMYEGLMLSTESGFARLYRAIADALGSQLPAVDFAAYAREVSAFEEEYAEQRKSADLVPSLDSAPERVRNPRALCISSPQFMQLGLENQIESVLAAFPSDVSRARLFDSMSVRRALTDDRFDVVHIAAFVCPRSGTVYFSDVDTQSGKPSPTAEPDVIRAEDLVRLFRNAGVRLAVITSGDSLALATSLIATCHVVAARDMISAKMAAAWVDAFYRALVTEPLSVALDHAINVSGAPMRLYARQPVSVDVVFERSATVGTVA
jgi:hypothetical protein